MLAQLADGVPLALLCVVTIDFPRVTVLPPAPEAEWLQGAWYAVLMAGLLYVGYHGILVGLQGATLGKSLLGLRVVRTDGSRCRLWRGLLRAAVEVLPVVPAALPFAAVSRTAGFISGGTLGRFAGLSPVYRLSLLLCVAGVLTYLWIAHDRRRRGLHDLAAGTLVVRRSG